MTDVYLYIYDLSLGLAKKVAPILLDKNIEGIWHTSIGMYLQFSFLIIKFKTS